MKVSELVELWAAPEYLKKFKRELKHCWNDTVDDAQIDVMEALNMDTVELQREATNYYEAMNELEED